MIGRHLFFLHLFRARADRLPDVTTERRRRFQNCRIAPIKPKRLGGRFLRKIVGASYAASLESRKCSEIALGFRESRFLRDASESSYGSCSKQGPIGSRYTVAGTQDRPAQNFHLLFLIIRHKPTAQNVPFRDELFDVASRNYKRNLKRNRNLCLAWCSSS